MKLLSTAVFTGPNVFAPYPVVYQRVDLAGLEAWPSGRLGATFARELLALLPGLDDHAPGKRGGGFGKRILEAEDGQGIPFALLLGHVAVELERRHSALGKPRTVLLRGTGTKQETFFGYEDAEIAALAAKAALRLLAALLPAEARGAVGETASSGGAAGLLQDFDRAAERLALEPTTGLLLRAAEARGIPWKRVLPRGKVLALGQGGYQLRLQGCLSDRTPAEALALLAEKNGVFQNLIRCGLPAAEAPRGGAARPADGVARYRLLLFGGDLVSALRLDEDGPVAVTDRVHEEVRIHAERAARMLRLDVAGLSYRASDIAQSPAESKGVFTWITAAPDLTRHDRAQPKRDLAGRLIERLFPAKSRGRIPLAAVTGTNGKTTTARMLARILGSGGRTVGLTTTDGAYVGEELVMQGDVAGRTGAAAVLGDPRVEAAVLETARGGLVKLGTEFDFCDVAAVTNITSDHIGIDGVDSLEQMARVKQSLLRLARDRAVVNADDPLCLQIAGEVKPRELCLVTMEQDNEAVAAHLRDGGPAVVLGPKNKGEMVVLVEQGKAEPLMPAKEIPATLGGCARHNIQNAMMAAALARGLGVPQEAIRKALAGFENSFEMSAGRLNIFDSHPFLVAMDYGHNPEGIEVVSQALQARYPERRRIGVLTVVGSRHAEQIQATAKAVSGLYDHFVCGRDNTYSFKPESLGQRGFPGEEIPQRLADALAAEGVAAKRLTVRTSCSEAIEAGLSLAKAGDLVAIFTDEPSRTRDIVMAFKPGS